MKTKNVKVLLSAAMVLFIAWALVACTKKKDAAPVVVKTDLTTAIASANVLITSTHEGVAAGNYKRGSQAPLIAVIAQSQAVVDNTAAAQADVTTATANLAAAVATYQTNLVAGIDPTNLVGQWTFDEIATASADAVIKDYSGGHHDGALKEGGAFWAGSGLATLAADRYGIAGKALHFDKGQNVEIPYNSSLNPATISISLWAKQDVESVIYTQQYMVSMNRKNGYKLQLQYAPIAQFTARALVSAGDTIVYDKDQHDGTLTQGAWYHVVVTFGGGHEIFYINGLMIYDWGASATELVPGTILSIAAKPVNLTFGQDLPSDKYTTDPGSPNYPPDGGFFHGTLDEIRIYKSVLTTDQVTAIYNLEKP
jgi:Concanavalin A-like lectin/glucanases superfamily